MAHLVQAAVWTAGLDDRLTDSGLISFQLCKAYAPPVGVKGQISTVCLYTAGGNLASKDNFILFYLGRFDGGTVFRCIMISPGKVFLGRIEDEGGSSPVEWCNRFVSFGVGYALSWSGGSSCWVGWGVSRDLVRMSRLR